MNQMTEAQLQSAATAMSMTVEQARIFMAEQQASSKVYDVPNTAAVARTTAEVFVRVLNFVRWHAPDMEATRTSLLDRLAKVISSDHQVQLPCTLRELDRLKIALDFSIDHAKTENMIAVRSALKIAQGHLKSEARRFAGLSS